MTEIICVQHVTFTYARSATPAIAGLDFAIPRGEIFGFLGPSGAGKSTTQKLLIGLLKGYAGQITILGRDLARWGADYYERIGVSFELPNHFLKLTALENLGYFRALYRRPTQPPQTLLELVGLGNDAHTPVGQFSKGMQSRLNVARALLHSPDVLFLDEPTAGLDPRNARRIKDLIKAQQQAGTTIFLTTHNMAVAEELCDRVAFIVDGRIALIDAPRALKLQHGQALVQVEYGLDGQVVQQTFPLERLGDNTAFLNLLRSAPIQTMHTQEATLEDIFIRVTGKSLT